MAKNIVDFFIDRPLIVNLITVLIIVAGLLSVFGLQKETFPKIDFDVIIIRTAYQGSSAEDVEKLVTISIERQLKGVDGIKKMNGISAEGASIFYIEVDPDNDVDVVLEDIKNAVDTVDDLPADADIPSVRSINNKNRAVLKVALTGAEYNTLRTASKDLRDKLELNPKVAFVDLDGYRIDDIRIEVDPLKLNDYELTISEVASAISERNLNLSAGKLEGTNSDIIVRTVSEFESLDEIKGVVVRSNATGRRVRISDVAKVTRSPVDGTILQRSNGKEAIFLNVKIKPNADIIDTTEQIKKTSEEFVKLKGLDSLSLGFVDDMSFYVKRRLEVLKNNGLYGIVLVLICLLFFLNVSTSLVTSSGAPIAFLCTFIVMQYFGMSINLISMFALILVLGMLVDDSIIVAEHFYAHLEEGQDPKTAARNAALETMKPVLATVLTTIVAFGSLFFMGGMMGKFLWSVPAMVIICLIVSFLECFLILPSHLAEFCRLGKKSALKKTRWYDKLLKMYRSALTRVVKHSGKTCFTFVIILIASLFLAKTMRFELFPGDDVRIVFFQLKGKVGTPLEVTDDRVGKLEKIIMKLKDDELDQVKAQVGVLRGEHSNKRGNHYGSVIAYLTQSTDRERSTGEIIKEISAKAKKAIPDYELTVDKIQGGPPRGKPVEIELTGKSIDSLKIAAKQINKLLQEQPGVTTTEVDFEEGKQQVLIKVNDEEARRLGLTTRNIALELRRALAMDPLTEIRESDEDIEIKVVLDKKSRSTVDSLKLLHVLNNQGRRIPISRVVNFGMSPGAFIIRRLNRKRVISISGVLDKTITTPLQITNVMKPKLDELFKDRKDINVKFGGENKDTKDSMKELMKAGVISLLCIFFILVAMFGSLGQPFVIMFAIPFGLIGVILAFKLLGKALGFMALMGVVGLIGVVVNDSIVLVNFINQLRKDKTQDLLDSVVDASVSRFRPVILTTVTTVAGLLPVAHAPGGDPFLKPMAMSFAWGLLVATAVTLIFIPCAYVIYEKTLNFFQNMSFFTKEVSEKVT